MDDYQKSLHTMESKRAETNQSPKAEDVSEGHESKEFDSRKIESEGMTKSDGQARIRKEPDMKGSKSNPECHESSQSETGRPRNASKEIKGIQSDTTHKTRIYSISANLNSSSTQRQNKPNKKYRVDRGKLQQLNTFSFQDRKDFASTGPSHLSTDQQRTAANNPSPYGLATIWEIGETPIKDCKTPKMHLSKHNKCRKHECPNTRGLLICRVCRLIFPKKAKLDLYVVDYNPKECIKCDKCGICFPNVRSLQRHQRFNRCEFCQEYFERPLELGIHRVYCKEQKVKFKETPKSVHSAASSGSKSAVDRRTKVKSESDMKTRTSSTEGYNIKSFQSASGHSHSNFAQKENKPNKEDRMKGEKLLQSITLSFQHQIDLAEPGPSLPITYQQRAQKLRDEAEVHFDCIACSRPFANYRDFKHHYPFCRKLLESKRHGRNEFNSQSDNSNHKMEKNLNCERCSRRFSKVDDCKKHMIENPFCYMQ